MDIRLIGCDYENLRRILGVPRGGTATEENDCEFSLKMAKCTAVGISETNNERSANTLPRG